MDAKKISLYIFWILASLLSVNGQGMINNVILKPSLAVLVYVLNSMAPRMLCYIHDTASMGTVCSTPHVSWALCYSLVCNYTLLQLRAVIDTLRQHLEKHGYTVLHECVVCTLYTSNC